MKGSEEVRNTIIIILHYLPQLSTSLFFLGLILSPLISLSMDQILCLLLYRSIWRSHGLGAIANFVRGPAPTTVSGETPIGWALYVNPLCPLLVTPPHLFCFSGQKGNVACGFMFAMASQELLLLKLSWLSVGSWYCWLDRMHPSNSVGSDPQTLVLKAQGSSWQLIWLQVQSCCSLLGLFCTDVTFLEQRHRTRSIGEVGVWKQNDGTWSLKLVLPHSVFLKSRLQVCFSGQH